MTRGARPASPLTVDACVEQLRPLHAQLCPRQVLGVRIGLRAGALLGVHVPRRDKRLLVLVETDGCFTDGISVATGCWVGRRTLRVVDLGKVAATVVDTVTDRAWRIWPRQGVRDAAWRYAPLAPDAWHAQRDGYRCMPAEELLQAEVVRLSVPAAQILAPTPVPRTLCTVCGEEILNARQVVLAGRIVCRACGGEAYYRPVRRPDRPRVAQSSREPPSSVRGIVRPPDGG